MLYFDDFMEAIDSLPEEFGENLIMIRNLDQQVQSSITPLNLKISTFFENCKALRLSEKEKEEELHRINTEFDRLLHYSKTKIDIVQENSETYQKLLKKLDSELEKFRLELEADNSGVTSKIEHRIRTLLGRNLPLANRLDKRRTKYRNAHLLNANRVISRRRQMYPHDAPERQFYVLKRRFAAFDTSPMPLPLVSSYNGSGVSFLPEDTSNTLISDGIRHIPSTVSIATEDQHITEHDFNAFHTDSRDFCGEEDDLHISIDSNKRGRTHGTPQRSAGTPVEVPGRDIHRIHHGTSCYSPFMTVSDTEPVALGTGSSNVVPDQSIDDLLANPGTSVSPSIKCNESPRWVSATTANDKIRSSSIYSRRPSRISSSTMDSNEEATGYISANELRHPHYSSHSPVRSLKDSHQEPHLGATRSSNSEASEPRYCFCNGVSYGEMIGCDSPNCPYEWFHYPCVGLRVAPKGQWFCEECNPKGDSVYPKTMGASPSVRKKAIHRR